MKTERELFEEWFESTQINCKISDLDLGNHDNYWGNALEFSWQTWQAATYISRLSEMTINQIRKEAPKGAKGYAEIDGSIYYFIKSNYGWRQIKGNRIQFDDSHVDNHIKPLY